MRFYHTQPVEPHLLLVVCSSNLASAIAGCMGGDGRLGDGLGEFFAASGTEKAAIVMRSAADSSEMRGGRLAAPFALAAARSGIAGNGAPKFILDHVRHPPAGAWS